MSWFISLVQRARPLATDAGQATVEYALIIGGAIALAIGFIVWAKGSGTLESLLETIARQMLTAVG